MWKRLYSAGCPILQYLSCLDNKIDQIISKDNIAQTQYYLLFKKFCAYVELVNYPKNLMEKPSLPITIIDPRPNSKSKIQIESFREYFEILMSSSDYAIKTFESFIEKYK